MNAVLIAALLPYLGCAAADGWLHERGRRVPRIEQVLHALIAASLVGFFAAVFSGRVPVALVALGVFAVLHAWDAFGYHRGISTRERRIHTAANHCLLGFVAVWLWQVRQP